MLIVMLTMGTRGDVQPFIALGVQLKKLYGYRVRIATSNKFKTLVESYNLEFAVLEEDHQEPRSNPYHYSRSYINIAKPYFSPPISFLDQLNGYALEACQDADILLFTNLGMVGYHIAQKINKPFFYILFQPLFKNELLPCMMFSGFEKYQTKFTNRLGYFLYEQFMWQGVRVTINRWRCNTLHLPPTSFWGPIHEIQHNQHPVLHAYSHLITSEIQNLPKNHYNTGSWMLDEVSDYQCPSDLAEFLWKDTARPLYIGFGSVNNVNAKHLTAMITKALEITQQRAILFLGEGSLLVAKENKNIFILRDTLPHEWLFKQVSAIIYHGGGGTTANILRTGIPALGIVLMKFSDQYFWPKKLHQLGIGPKPFRYHQLNINLLVTAIQDLIQNLDYRRRAMAIAEQIRNEGGAKHAAHIIHHKLIASG